MHSNTPTNIDEYIASFPANVQTLLQQMRTTIQAAAPQATEAIKYAMPTFVYKGNLVHFAGYANHIGFYATPNGNDAFAEELRSYKIGKGSIQFTLDKPLPLDLVSRMVKLRVKQNEEKAAAKKAK